MVWQIVAAVLFFALIMVSIALHEMGHFVPAKLFRVRVRQYFIGFGPNIWRVQKGETEYGLKGIPLGGYCAMVGMLPPYREGKNTWLKRFADAVREADWEHVLETDVADNRLFYQKPFWQRLLIMAGGVMTNLVLAFALFLGVNLAWGQPDPNHLTLTVSAVDECIDSSDPNEPCAQTPAVAAGIEPGDRVASLNGTDVSTYDEYKAAILTTLTVDGDKYSAADVTVGVDRPGQGVITLPSAPGLVARFSDGEVRPYLGVYFESERVKVGPIGTLKDMGAMTWMSVQAIAKLPYYAWTTLRDLVTGAPRDPAGVMSVVGAARVAGEVASTNVLDSQSKLYLYLYLLGSINLFVGLLNLVPLLPFDGGYVAAGVYGVIRSAWAKLRRKPDPGPVDAAKLQPVAYVVGGFLVLMGAILIVADIFTPIHVF